jgi:hypothetical protein
VTETPTPMRVCTKVFSLLYISKLYASIQAFLKNNECTFVHSCPHVALPMDIIKKTEVESMYSKRYKERTSMIWKWARISAKAPPQREGLG